MRVPIDWLKDFVDIRMKTEALASVLTMGGLEVESCDKTADGEIFELGVTPNRSDCLSVIGVARDIHALTDSNFNQRKINPPKGSGKISDFATVTVKAKKECPRYTARVIKGIKVAESPKWLAKRLLASGIRPVSNVVDATNYVMLELGQPLHAFDLKRLNGGNIIVQTAKDGTVFKTLDGEERKLCKDDLQICDSKGAVALAGVMGGLNSQIENDTTDVLLESAYFEPLGVRRTSKRLMLSSESSRRFERQVDPNGVVNALHRLTAIILETAGGTATEDWIDVYPVKIKSKVVAVEEKEIERILGIKISVQKIKKILTALGCDIRPSPGKKISVHVPTFRPDIERPIDLVEEIARINGYGEIPESMPCMKMAPAVLGEYAKEDKLLHDALINLGFSESAFYGFTSEESLGHFEGVVEERIHISNPLSEDEAVMRTTLLTGLLDAAKVNVNRQRRDVRLFASGYIYQKIQGKCKETRSIAGIMFGKRFPLAWERAKEEVDFYDIKGAAEMLFSALSVAKHVEYSRGETLKFMHPGEFSVVLLGGKKIGFVGQLHPDVAAKWELDCPVFVFEFNFEDIAKVAASFLPKYSPISRYPFVERDLAIVLDNGIPVARVEKTIADLKLNYLGSSRIFDVFKGKSLPQGKKSVAITLRFTKDDGTLTDAEVGSAQEKIIAALGNDLGAVLRTG